MKSAKQDDINEIQRIILLQLDAAEPACLPFDILARGVQLFGIKCNLEEMQHAINQLVVERKILALADDSDLLSKRYKLSTGNQ